jgi:hypothetical protein
MFPHGIIRVTNRVVIKRSIKPASIVRCQRQAVLKSHRQVGVADEVSTIQESVVPARLDDTPRVRIIEATCREEWSISKDSTERR